MAVDVATGPAEVDLPVDADQAVRRGRSGRRRARCTEWRRMPGTWGHLPSIVDKISNACFREYRHVLNPGSDSGGCARSSADRFLADFGAADGLVLLPVSDQHRDRGGRPGAAEPYRGWVWSLRWCWPIDGSSSPLSCRRRRRSRTARSPATSIPTASGPRYRERPPLRHPAPGPVASPGWPARASTWTLGAGRGRPPLCSVVKVTRGDDPWKPPAGRPASTSMNSSTARCSILRRAGSVERPL